MWYKFGVGTAMGLGDTRPNVGTGMDYLCVLGTITLQVNSYLSNHILD